MRQKHRYQAGKEYRYWFLFIPLTAFSAFLVLAGILLDGPSTVFYGMRDILFNQDNLYTDYIALGGLGAALVNCGLVCLFSLFLLYLDGDPLNGFTLVTMGLMAGFSLFGKNLINMLPILLGVLIYAKVKRERFAKYTNVALLATTLGPAVSFLIFHPEKPLPVLGLIMGVVIGFVFPALAAYTFRILDGMNLYNAGFAGGILGMVLIPLLNAVDHGPSTVYFWSTEYSLPLGILVVVACAGLIVLGAIHGGDDVMDRYRHLLRTGGRLPSDYLRTYGLSTVCINMGVNGLLALIYILAVGGVINGPTLGGILTVMGFSAYGKHARNIAPIMIGVYIGNLINSVPMDNASMQIAGLFGTTLAPIAGIFGWPFGILAGILHSCVVLYSGAAIGGVNLYNNGFSGGLIALVLYLFLPSSSIPAGLLTTTKSSTKSSRKTASWMKRRWVLTRMTNLSLQKMKMKQKKVRLKINKRILGRTQSNLLCVLFLYFASKAVGCGRFSVKKDFRKNKEK